MKKTVLWLSMLTKRLYKQPTFVLLLLLVPVLVLGYTAAAQGDSGMVTVALAQEGSDPLASQLIESLRSDDTQLLRFVLCGNGADARQQVAAGKADMAWVFPADTQARLEAYGADPDEDNAIASVLVREDTVLLKLAREKLSQVFYEQVSQLLYIRYVRANVPQLESLSDGDLLVFYRTREIAQELFTFDEADPAMANVQTVHYLTAPVRGMLAVVIALCGLATAMYWIRDSRRGTFAWVAAQKQPAVELACQLVSLGNVTAAAVVTLAFTGQAGCWWRELASAAMYCLCCASFCMLLRRLCGSASVLGMLVPVLVVTMLVVCPVFFDLGQLRFVQYLLPPTYFINAVYNLKYLGYMALYTLAAFGLQALLPNRT